MSTLLQLAQATAEVVHPAPGENDARVAQLTAEVVTPLNPGEIEHPDLLLGQVSVEVVSPKLGLPFIISQATAEVVYNPPALRAALLIEPNWENEVIVTMRVASESIQADAMERARRSRSLVPAFELQAEFETYDDHAEARQLERWLRESVGEAVLVPLWTDAAALTGQAAGNLIPCDASYRAFAGRAAVVWRNSTTHEIVTVAAVDENGVTTHEPLKGTWGAGDVVVPLFRSAPLDGSQPLEWASAFSNRAAIRVSEGVQRAAALVGLPALAAFRGAPIFPLPFNWRIKPESAWARRVRIHEAETGIVAATPLTSTTEATVRATVDMNGRFQIALLRAWFSASMGRARRFWLPTDKADLVVREIDGNMIYLQPTGYPVGEFAHRSRRAVFLRDMVAGAWHARKVVAAGEDEDGEWLELEEPIAALGDGSQLSFLLLVRSQLDDVRFEHSSTEHATAALEFVELPEEAGNVLAAGGHADGVLSAAGEVLP